MTPPVRSGSLAAALLNLRWLLGSRGIAAVLSLFYLAIVTRTLGPAGFGQFALVTGIGQAVVSIVGFQTWQIIVRYGTHHLQEGRPAGLARLIKAAIALDVAGALAGATISALAIALLGPSFGWSAETRQQAFLFCCTVLIAVKSTPIGVLRLYDRFGAAAAGDAAIPVVRLLGSLAVLAAGPSVTAFLIAWAASEVASSLLYWLLAHGAARALPWRASPLSYARLAQENPGFARFALATNGGQTLMLTTRQLPVLLVGYFASPAAAGAYRLAHQLGRSMAQGAQLFARALLPELSRIHTAGGGNAEFARMIGRIVRTTAIGGGALLLVILVAGRHVLHLVAGPAFDAAYPLLLLLGTAAILDLVGVSFDPALVASGRAGLSFRLQATGAVVLIALMVLLIPRLGISGAAIAVLAGSATSLALLALAVRRLLRRRDTDPALYVALAEPPPAESAGED